jgi:hypothetical protein
MANAGPNQTVNEGVTVTVSGSGSDPDPGQTVTFSWSQVAGPPVTINNPNSATANFVTPNVPDGTCATLTLELKVTDSCGTMTTEPVNVTVGSVMIGRDNSNGNCVVVRMTGVGNLATYCWRRPDGTQVQGLCTVTPNPNEPLVLNARSTNADPNLIEGFLDTFRRSGDLRLTVPRPGRGGVPRSFNIHDTNTLDSNCTCP